MKMHWFVFALGLIGVVASLAAAPPAVTPEEIDRAIRELGSETYLTREKASEYLWAVGPPAEAALRQALNSKDAEVISRIRDLLDKIPYGITPDSPKKVVGLITRARVSSLESWPDIVNEMFEDGAEGLALARQIADKQTDELRRVSFRRGIDKVSWRLVPKLVANDKLDLTEELLGRSAAWTGADAKTDFTLLRNYAATVRLRGHLDTERAKWEKWSAGPPGLLGFVDDQTPDGPAARAVAAFLAKAGGDHQKELSLVQNLPNPWREMALFDARKWAELAHVPLNPMATTRVQSPMVAAAMKMAYLNLAGQVAERDKARREFEAAIENQNTAGQNHWFAFRAMLLDRRPADALAFAEKSNDSRVQFARGEILAQMGNISQAKTVLENLKPGGGTNRLQIQAGIARLSYLTGDRDALAAQIESMNTGRYTNSADQLGARAAITRFVTIGLMDAATEQAIAAIEGDPDTAALVFAVLYPNATTAAEAWFSYFMRSPGLTTVADAVRRIGSLIDDRLTEPDGQKELEAALKWAAERPANVRDKLLRGFGEACQAAGLNERAVSLFQQSAQLQPVDGNIRLGDYFARSGDWKQAAVAYERALQANPNSQLPHVRFLAGLAKSKSGNANAGSLMQLVAQLSLLGVERTQSTLPRDEIARNQFCSELGKRADYAPEIAEAVRNQTRLIVDLSFPWSQYAYSAQAFLCRDPLGYTDPQMAADANQLFLLRTLRTGSLFLKHEDYLTALHRLAAAEAKAHLAKGRLAEAIAAANFAHATLPTTSALAVEIVPELVKRGHPAEADAFYAKVAGVLDRLCKEYPNSWVFLGQRAWLAARCGRELDAALGWAQSAVKMQPKDTDLLEILAEVQFQRKEVDAAKASLSKALELSPRSFRIAKLLKRVAAGDPSQPYLQ